MTKAHSYHTTGFLNYHIRLVMQKSESILSHTYLRQILHYSIITGEFYRLKSTNSRAKVGQTAGTLRKDDYREIMVNNKTYLSHRLAWFWVVGSFPENYIDHKNGIKDANYWLNLRAANRSENNCNIRMKSNNTSGYKGVYWNKKLQKWQVSIAKNNKKKHLGLFENIKEAYAARIKAEKELHGDFARI